MVENDNILRELETIVSHSLINNKTTMCACCHCNRLPKAAVYIAESVVDTVAYEWAGQMMYFTVQRGSTNGALGAYSTLGKEFLIEFAACLRSHLKNNAPLPACFNCPHEHGHWNSAINIIMHDILSFLAGQHCYIPFDSNRRNKLIYREFTGNNIPQLVRKYRIGTQAIYKILAKVRAINKAKRESLIVS